MEIKAGYAVCLKSAPETLMTVSKIKKTSDIFGFGSKIMKENLRFIGFFDDDYIILCSWCR